MVFSEISNQPKIGTNISVLFSHLKISIAINKRTNTIEIIKIILPSLSCLKVFGFILKILPTTK